MKVVFLLSSVSSKGAGVTEVARQLSIQLRTIPGMDVGVVGLQDDAEGSARLDWQSIPVCACKMLGPRSFGYAPDLLPTLQAVQPTLIHAHGLWTYPSLANLRYASNGRPYIVSCHGMLDPWALQNARWKKVLALRLFERVRLDRAACLHALSTAELHAIRAMGLRNPVCVIPNGVSLPDLSDAQLAPERVLQTTRGQHVLLHLGRIHAKKGLSELIEAFSMTSRSERPSEQWVLRIVGWETNPGYRQELERQVSSLGLGARVRFLGPMYGAEKAAALRGSTAFVLASRSEGMPMAILEAWAYGLPVLMTPECNLSAGFDAGAAIRIGLDAEPIADGLRTLFQLGSRDLEDIGARGRALVERAFTWKSVGQRLSAVYNWLASSGPYPDCIEYDSQSPQARAP